MKPLHLLVIIVSVSITTSLLTTAAVEFYRTDAVHELPTRIVVSDVFGLAVGEDMNFGSVIPGAGSMKVFYVHGDEKSHVVEIEGGGDLGPWTTFVPNNFLIQPYETINVTVAVNIPEWVEYGNYTGTMTVKMKKP